VFFIYAGAKKFIPKPASNKVVSNEDFVKAFQENKFESPITFRMAIKTLKACDFMLMVGVLQLLAGVLILIPHTRLIGLLVLLPVAVNIFCFHFFMDNRPEEDIETGFLLLLNVILVLFYYRHFKALVVKNWALKFIKSV